MSTEIHDRTKQLRVIARRFGLSEVVEHLDSRERDAELGLMVLIIGEGNFGKSSLINALAGRDVAAVAAVPKTYKVDLYLQPRAGPEHAILRVAGSDQTASVTLEEARRRCQEDEDQVSAAAKRKEKTRPSILETFWCLENMAIGKDLCLVDTPGLAQSLLGTQVTATSLVKGLGATYSVEEVWDKWCHRADVVLWCFQADKVESKESRTKLEAVLAKYSKTIVPVATKGDLIPADRRDEIDERFRREYGSLLGGDAQDPLFLTVCSPKSPLYGLGVKALRDHLLGLAPEARERKQQATRQFLADEARHVESVLVTSADLAVRNLRTIAGAADEIALEGMSRFREALAAVHKRGSMFVSNLRHGLNRELPLIAWDLTENWLKMKSANKQMFGPNPQQKDELGRLALGRLEKLVDISPLIQDLNAILNGAGDETCNIAEVIAAVRTLEAVKINQNGKEWSTSIQMRLGLERTRIRQDIVLPKLVLQLPGLASTLWISIQELFARSRVPRTTLTRAEEKFLSSVCSLVSEKLADIDRVGREYFTSSVAARLAESADRAFVDASGTGVRELGATLKQLDDDVQALRGMLPNPDVRPCTFELWAQYWTSSSPSEVLVPDLVSRLLAHRLEQIRDHVGRFPGLPPRQLRPRELKTFRKTHRRFVREASEGEAKRGKAGGWPFSGVFRLGFRDSRLTCEFGTYEIPKFLEVSGRPSEYAIHRSRTLGSVLTSEETTDFPSALKHKFEEWISAEPVLARIDEELDEHFPDLRLTGLGQLLIWTLAGQYSGALSSRMSSFPKSVEVEVAVPILTLGPLRTCPELPPGLVISLSLATAWLGSGHLGPWSGLVGFGVILASASWSRLALRSRLRSRVRDALRRVGHELSIAAAQEVSAGIKRATIEKAVRQLASRLNPRPLQRAMSGKLE